MSDTAEIEVKALSLENRARALIISTRAEYAAANAEGEYVAALEKEIHEKCDPVCATADAAHKAATRQRSAFLAPVLAAKAVIASKMIAFDSAERARAAEARRIAEAEARRKADEEALAVALELEAQGMPEAADIALAEPVVERVQVAEAPKLEGVSYRTIWSAEVLDFPALVRAVAEGKASYAYLLPNSTSLNGAAKIEESGLAIPGVKAISETVQARRA